MKYNNLIPILIFLLLLLNPISSKGDSIIFIDQESTLTIYTYNSLLADPGYAFDRAFEEFANLENGSVEVKLLEDAGAIIAKATAEKGDPVADVLIGIDNVLIFQARKQELLTPYKPNGVDNLIDGLVEGLANDYYLTPYDYGVISLWYLKDQLQTDINLDEFSLSNLLNEDLASQLIVENPLLSSPGLGFFLSSIALYGDKDSEIEGVTKGSWQDLWRSLSENSRLTDSWGDALSLMYTEEEGRPMMVSYTTSPAYGACLFNDTSTAALLPNEDDKLWGWQQIEGIGLVNGAPHPTLAEKFIDWFISEELQNQIYQNQWIYPALKGIEQPDCFDIAIDQSDISPLNEKITQEKLETNLDNWLDTWELVWVEGPSNRLDYGGLDFVGVLMLILILLKRRIKMV